MPQPVLLSRPAPRAAPAACPEPPATDRSRRTLSGAVEPLVPALRLGAQVALSRPAARSPFLAPCGPVSPNRRSVADESPLAPRGPAALARPTEPAGRPLAAARSPFLTPCGPVAPARKGFADESCRREAGRLARAGRWPGHGLALALALLAAGVLSAQEPVFPGKEWERTDPQAAGFAPARLEALRGYLATLDTTAMMAVHRGRVIFEYGDLSRLSYLASARKSVLAMLYGNYVAGGQIQLNRTLRELEMDDLQGLLPVEKEATVEHLITARSGVYHPASNAGDSTALAPPRGSQKPGTYYLYNNWDFNAAGAVFEKLTGTDIYDALQAGLAVPIGMQDFDRARQQKSGDGKRSRYPAYHMWLSARDMARIGYLMLREGNWAGKQVVPRDWARRIVSLATPLAQLYPVVQRESSYGSGILWGYGYMWWVWDSPGQGGAFSGSYSAQGAFGQYITVFPRRDLVVVHKTDPQQPRPNESQTPPRPRSVTGFEYHTALQILLGAGQPR